MNTISRVPSIVAGTITALLALFLCGSHCCHRESLILEIPLIILTPVLSYMWTRRAKTEGKAWLRTVVAVVFAVFGLVAYLTWLHSDSFPNTLLSRRALEEEARIYKMAERATQQSTAPLPRTPQAGRSEGAR